MAECDIESHCDPDQDSPQQCTSSLYNAMIHPFVRFNIYGVLWYQGTSMMNLFWITHPMYLGSWVHYPKVCKNFFSFTGEANVGYHNELYPCTFYHLINEWRSKWASNSNTNPNFPFGFVQLSTKGPVDPTPLLRWHQTYDFGYVPNEIMQV